jgi:hypothetical protein
MWHRSDAAGFRGLTVTVTSHDRRSTLRNGEVGHAHGHDTIAAALAVDAPHADLRVYRDGVLSASVRADGGRACASFSPDGARVIRILAIASDRPIADPSLSGFDADALAVDVAGASLEMVRIMVTP